MVISSFFKKIIIFLSIGLFAVNPILVRAETEVFPDATSTTESSVTSTTAVGEIVSVPEAVVLARELVPEPLVRVGLYKTNQPVRFKSDFVYEIWNGAELKGVILAGELVELSYEKGLYSLKSGSLEFGSKDYFRFVPEDQNSFFSLENYIRPVKGRAKINFNIYRGSLEYRYSPKSKMPFVINELPLEMYMGGIAEVNDGAPAEFIKALSVAARSYAYAMISKSPPTEKRLFDVYATTADQLYLGYNSEKTMPNFVAGTIATAGELVTYKSNPVITFYFTRSNGKTKSAGASRPWLRSVEAKYDKGKAWLGHGLGMSNQDALQRAKKDGWNYEEILEHYYSDTKVEKVY